MALIRRQKSNRRYDLTVELPLTDKQGVPVIRDRRRLPERRKAKPSLIDMIVILSKMATD